VVRQRYRRSHRPLSTRLLEQKRAVSAAFTRKQNRAPSGGPDQALPTIDSHDVPCVARAFYRGVESGGSILHAVFRVGGLDPNPVRAGRCHLPGDQAGTAAAGREADRPADEHEDAVLESH
jgi:hypothetical protein